MPSKFQRTGSSDLGTHWATGTTRVHLRESWRLVHEGDEAYSRPHASSCSAAATQVEVMAAVCRPPSNCQTYVWMHSVALCVRRRLNTLKHSARVIQDHCNRRGSPAITLTYT